MTPEAITVLKAASNIASSKSHIECVSEHLLAALLANAQVIDMFAGVGIDIAEAIAATEEVLEQIEPQLTSIPHVARSRELESIIARAEVHAKSETRQTNAAHLLIAIFQEKSSKAIYVLQRSGLTRAAAVEWFTKAGVIGLAADHKKKDDGKELVGADGDQAPQNRNGKSALAEFCLDLTELARDGKLPPMVGREAEIEKAIRILARKTKNNPVFVGDAGVGKTAIAEGIAQKIAGGEVPEMFKPMRILSLNMGALVAGTQYRGEFEARVQSLLKECAADGKVILFVDEIHNMLGAGRASGAPMDAANMMKPALARGELRCMGATTRDEYRKYIEKDEALARRFRQVSVEEPTMEAMRLIMKRVGEEYGKYHGVQYDARAIEAALNLTARYLPNRKFPDKAIDAIDEAGAQAKLDGKLKIAVPEMERVVATLANLPPATVDADEARLLKSLEDKLAARVFDQGEAIGQVVRAVQMHRAGVSDPNQPAGSYLFVGPTGVGKTELAKQLAAELGLPFERFDMSEYQESHTVARLIGSPPGYVGYEEGGKLTNTIEKHPHCVLLLDEIEKANAKIFDTLLQVMDYGKLTDGQGRSTDFRNVILIMTSNCGIKASERGPLGFTGSAADASRSAIDKAVADTFSAEFRNRLSAVVHFGKLTQETARNVVAKFIRETAERLKGRKVTVEVSDAAKDKLATLGFDPSMGARPAARIIREKVQQPLSQMILFGELANGGKALVDLDAAGEVVVIASAGGDCRRARAPRGSMPQ